MLLRRAWPWSGEGRLGLGEIVGVGEIEGSPSAVGWCSAEQGGKKCVNMVSLCDMFIQLDLLSS